MAQVLRSMPPVWETQMKALAPGVGSSLVLGAVDIWENEQADENSLPVSLRKNIFKVNGKCILGKSYG